MKDSYSFFEEENESDLKGNSSTKQSLLDVKNSILSTQISKERGFRTLSIGFARNELCTLGTNKVKRRLAKIATKNSRARLFRTILDLEDANLCAKKYFGKTRRRYYEMKDTLLRDVISLANEMKLNHGYGKDEKQTFHSKVYYVEFNGIQFSWHCQGTYHGVPNFEDSWDGIKHSSLGKLEMLILNEFPTILDKK